VEKMDAYSVLLFLVGDFVVCMCFESMRDDISANLVRIASLQGWWFPGWGRREKSISLSERG